MVENPGCALVRFRCCFKCFFVNSAWVVLDVYDYVMTNLPMMPWVIKGCSTDGSEEITFHLLLEYSMLAAGYIPKLTLRMDMAQHPTFAYTCRTSFYILSGFRLLERSSYKNRSGGGANTHSLSV